VSTEGKRTGFLIKFTETERARLDRLRELTGILNRTDVIRLALIRLLTEEERRTAKP
jgi:metal-responsive CopG/Arc/MetJ family transcriptional regulator